MTNQNPPSVLYHYTNQDGLLGILKESTLRATKIQYLNDASELVRPLQFAKEILKERRNKLGEHEPERGKVEEMLYEVDASPDINICVFAFCTEGDRLSQWRSYGIPGPGYSIGFSSAKLDETLTPLGFKLHPCAYYEYDDQYKIIKEFINQSIESTTPRQFIKELLIKASAIKHTAFEDEGEWRLVSTAPRSYGDSEFGFKSGLSTVVPYYSLPLDPSCIVEIIVGPSPHPELARGAVGGLRFRYNLKAVDQWHIKSSKIPFRNW